MSVAIASKHASSSAVIVRADSSGADASERPPSECRTSDSQTFTTILRREGNHSAASVTAATDPFDPS